ncbi:hypothetical protein [Prochlorococcus sp. MIT 1341]|uniref:hypothetical protein n=1 Tax=Prochlorococcus sp. MIT 1341 TaxID=3096221 RepID=UPI002A766366|nr:hypothetical protein [Prochlorococcus sp. MIT 1341]
MAKESTHRAEELKDQGWSNEDVARYAELWDYRQRWGAINLEREDRLFLRKAEAALPKILSGKTAIRKPIKEKSYYRWLLFYLDAMNSAEASYGLQEGHRGAWAILLEEELRVLEYYEPVLGLPDTIKARALVQIREEILKTAQEENSGKSKQEVFDFKAPLEALKKTESTNWRFLRDGECSDDKSYLILDKMAVKTFRKEVRTRISTLLRDLFPSLAETDKPSPPDDWSRNQPE